MKEHKSGVILEFDTVPEVQDCIKEWQKILFLEDWIIKGLIKDNIINEYGEELNGQNTLQIDNKCSCIAIRKATDDTRDRIVTLCQEVTLVHELLHCKYNWLAKNERTIEYAYYDTMEHALLEQMAKSLIMAKYNLTFDFFKNF